MALTICTKCGERITDYASVCAHCGQPRIPRGAPSAPVAATAPAETIAYVHPVQAGAASPAVISSMPEPTLAYVHPMQPGAAAPLTRAPYFPVAPNKFIILCLCTFNIYEIYWFYKMWRRIQDESGEKVSPVLRALFSPIFAFSLFGRVRQRADAAHVQAGWSGNTLAVLYLLFNLLVRLPDPWWLISLFSFLVMLPVVKTAEEVNLQSGASEDLNAKLSGANIATMVFGGIFLALAIIGTFAPK